MRLVSHTWRGSTADSAKKLTADQLQSLVAPIALYPDDLLAIVLLGPRLGSSADASTAFTDHFADEGNRLRDLVVD